MYTLLKSLDDRFFSANPPTATDPDVVKLESLRGQLMNKGMSEGLSTASAIRAYLMTQTDENNQNLWSKAVQLWQKMQAMREEMHNFFGEPPQEA